MTWCGGRGGRCGLGGGLHHGYIVPRPLSLRCEHCFELITAVGGRSIILTRTFPLSASPAPRPAPRAFRCNSPRLTSSTIHRRWDEKGSLWHLVPHKEHPHRTYHALSSSCTALTRSVKREPPIAKCKPRSHRYTQSTGLYTITSTLNTITKNKRTSSDRYSFHICCFRLIACNGVRFSSGRGVRWHTPEAFTPSSDPHNYVFLQLNAIFVHYLWAQNDHTLIGFEQN